MRICEDTDSSASDEWQKHQDSIMLELATEQRTIKLDAYKLILAVERSIATSPPADADAPLPVVTEPFPERYRIKMDADFARYSNRFQCGCGETEHFPAIYATSDRRQLPPCEIALQSERVAATRMLLALAKVKDQRTTSTLLEKVGRRFSCGTCEAAGEPDIKTIAIDFHKMVHISPELLAFSGLTIQFL